MKPEYRILLIAVLGTIAQMFLPWWSCLIVAGGVELVYGSPKFLSFFLGFYGVAIPWMLAGLIIDLQNNSLLSNRVLSMFELPQWPLLILVVTGLVGGVAGGFASWAGGQVKGLFTNKLAS